MQEATSAQRIVQKYKQTEKLQVDWTEIFLVVNGNEHIANPDVNKNRQQHVKWIKFPKPMLSQQYFCSQIT